jgi:photosystem II stability/assembly factor-like uncharacterized protein
MPVKHNRSSQPWTVLGGPQGGTISALAIGQDDNGYCLFIASPVGLYRSTGFQPGNLQAWERLANAPLGMMSLVVSPNFAEDHTVIAGTHTGIYFSENGGNTWRAAHMPLSTSMVLSLCFSPNYLLDGIILAGTLEDGIFISDCRGERWLSQSFGLLDPTAYCLAVSPDFTHDGLIFAGTGTTVYYSYNAGRAWRQLDFPEEAAPVLSMALVMKKSEAFTLFAGTEKQGLFRSIDQGQTWQPLNLPAATVNALSVTQDNTTLLAATETGILQSSDLGETWSEILVMPDAITLTFKDGMALAGIGDQGAWLAPHMTDWQPIQNLSIRSLLGLAMSSQFEKDGTAFIYGPEEGIWKTEDGGRSWQDINEGLPGLEINSLTLSPSFSIDQTLVAAANDGLLLSRDGGNDWTSLVEDPTQLVSISPNGKLLAAAFQEAGIRISDDLGESWESLAGPWDAGGRILALSITNLHQYYIAHLDGLGETMTLWQGKAGRFELVLSQEAGADRNPYVSFWFPAGPVINRPWFASMGSHVWKISSRAGGAYSHSSPTSEDAPPEAILALTGMQDPSGQVMILACTGQRVYKSQDARTWAPVQDFGSERAVALSLGSSYLADRSAYALLLGGAFCKLKL